MLELMIALAILAIIVRFASVSYAENVEKTRVYEASAYIAVMSGTIEGFISSNGAAPASLNDVGLGGSVDPWGYEYRYNPNMNQQGAGGKRKDRSLNPLNTDFDLYSVGEDGGTSQSLMPKVSDDDVIRANDGGYIGLAKDY